MSSGGFYYLEQFKDKGPSLSWRYTMDDDNNKERKKKKNSMMSGDRVMIPTRHEDPYRRCAKLCESFFSSFGFHVLAWVVDM